MMRAVRWKRFTLVLAWFDFWVGAYYDRTKRRLYIFLIPCVGFAIDFARPRCGQCRHWRDEDHPDNPHGVPMCWNSNSPWDQSICENTDEACNDFAYGRHNANAMARV